MSWDQYNTESLRSYLVGNASLEETERMDELSIAESEFAELLEAAEKDLVDAYVEGELYGDELSRFESHYLASPFRKEKVRFARAFREYAVEKTVANAESQTFEHKPDGGAGTFWTSLLPFATRRFTYGFAISAASVVVIGILGWLAVKYTSDKGVEVVTNINSKFDERTITPTPATQVLPTPSIVSPTGKQPPDERPTPTPPRPPTKVPPPTVIASFVLSPPLRGNQVPSVSIPAGAERASIRLELESDEHRFYAVELKNSADGRIVWSRSRLIATGSANARSLNFVLPLKLLETSTYIFTVSGLVTGQRVEIIGDYPFRVVR